MNHLNMDMDMDDMHVLSAFGYHFECHTMVVDECVNMPEAFELLMAKNAMT